MGITLSISAILIVSSLHFQRETPLVSQQLSHYAVSGSDWTGYLMNSSNTAYNNLEKTLSVNTITRDLGLVQIIDAGKTVTINDAIVSSILFANNTYYFGSWNGYYYAVDANSHAIKWKIQAAVIQARDQCYPTSAGISSNASLIDGILYFGGSDGYVYSVNAGNGSILWKTKISTPPDEFLWGSPVIGNNKVYIGVSSWGDCPLIRGRLVMLDQNSGNILQIHYTINENQLGNSIWNKPALIPSQNLVVIANGNGDSRSPENSAVVGLDWNTLQVKWIWQPPKSDISGDYDFGASCLAIPGKNEPFTQVLCHDKNSFVYALNVTSTSVILSWKRKLGLGGVGPEHGDGDISSGVYDGKNVYYSTTQTNQNGSFYHGAIYSLDPTTGKVIWHTLIQDSFPLSSLAGANDFLVSGNVYQNFDGSFNGYFYVLSMHDGSILYKQQVSDAIFGSPSIANGEILVPTADGHIYVYGLADMWGRANAVAGKTIDSQWQWQNKNPAYSSYSSNNGVTIQTHGSSIGQENYLYHSALAGDYSLTTHVSFVPSSSNQLAGLDYYHSDKDTIFVGVRSDGHGKLQYVMTMDQTGSPSVAYAVHEPVDQTLPVYLQLLSISSNVYGYASTDGAHWTMIGVVHPQFPADYVGVGAYHDSVQAAGTQGAAIFNELYLQQL